MYYSGLLVAMKGTDVIDDLTHISDLLDAEEQGLLLRLPCKVGDKVYVLEEEWVEMYESSSIVYEIEESKFEIYMFEEIGRWVFLTKAEAEKKLAEMEK